MSLSILWVSEDPERGGLFYLGLGVRLVRGLGDWVGGMVFSFLRLILNYRSWSEVGIFDGRIWRWAVASDMLSIVNSGMDGL